MYNSNDMEPFNFDVELVIDALKNHDKALLKSFEYFFTTLCGSNYTKDILTSAVFQLADTDLDTCRWALHNFYDLKLHDDVKEGVVMFAAQKLLDKGFIFGQDFSITHTGDIFINQNAEATLMTCTSASEHIFFEKIWQVFE